jgi:hypothetical protein
MIKAFYSISDDLLMVIFKKSSENILNYLHVNKRFRNVASKAKEFTIPDRKWTKELLFNVLSIFPNLRDLTILPLSLENEINMNGDFFDSLAKLCPSLQILHIGNSHTLFDDCVNKILSLFPSLRALFLTNCSNNGSSFIPVKFKLSPLVKTLLNPQEMLGAFGFSIEVFFFIKCVCL